MLSREKCQELKEAGFDQTLHYGDLYYAADGSLNVHTGSQSLSLAACLKCPSTDPSQKLYCVKLKGDKGE